MKKRNVIILMSCIVIGLVGCSNSTKKELYTPDLNKDKESYEAIVESLRVNLQYRYDLDNEKAKNISMLFTDNESAMNQLNFYKENIEDIDSQKLFISEYMKSAKEYYYEMKNWGMKHGLLYTDGSKTGLDVIVEDITPLNPGQQYIENQENIEDNTIDNGLTDEEIELKILEKENEMLNALDVKFKDPDNYVYEVTGGYNYTEEDIQNDLANLTSITEVADYIDTHYVSYLDIGDGEFIPHLLGLSIDDKNLTEDEWNNLSLEEVKERAVILLSKCYSEYNSYLDKDAEYYNSDEYKEYLRKTRDEYYANIEREKNKLREELLSQRNENETVDNNDYLMWCKSNEDYINYIEENDFTSEGLSEVIQKDGEDYYILWDNIYKFADDNGKLPINIEFVGFGETFKIETPQAPLSYYKGKDIKVIDWKIREDSAGIKSLFISFNFPDIQEKVDVSFIINNENKLVNEEHNIIKLFE